MKAVVATGYGPPEVLKVQEVPAPVLADDEVLVRVRASTVTAGDVRIRSSTWTQGFWPVARLMFGITRPRKAIPGNEFAGVVAAVGSAVRGFAPGDQVFGVVWGVRFAGANAEYVCIPGDGMILHRPPNLSDAEAAALPVGGLTALHFLRRAGTGPGQQILIVGGAGSVGSFAVQLAHHLGAEVTAVCGPTNVELVRSLGAAHVVDHTVDDFTTGEDRYDVVFDAAIKSSFSAATRVLRPGGLFLTLDWPIHLALWTRVAGDKQVIIGIARQRIDDLRRLRDLAAEGVLRPVIGATYPLAEVAEAHRHAETGHKRGNLVLTIGDQAPGSTISQ